MFIRFSSERSPDLGSVSFSEATERHEISKDPQRRVREGLNFVVTGFCWAWSIFGKQMRVTMRNTITAEWKMLSHAILYSKLHFSVFLVMFC